MKRVLDSLTTAVTLLAALAVLVVAERSLRRPSVAPAASLIGQHWSGPSIHQGSKATLVLVLSVNCHFCDESMPFYQRLLNERAPGVGIVAVFPQPLVVVLPHLAKYDVSPDQILSATTAPVSGLRATPTLLLLDAKQVVRNVWVGKLEASGEAAVLEALAVYRRL